jgi:hypothetical protein
MATPCQDAFKGQMIDKYLGSIKLARHTTPYSTTLHPAGGHSKTASWPFQGWPPADQAPYGRLSTPLPYPMPRPMPYPMPRPPVLRLILRSFPSFWLFTASVLRFGLLPTPSSGGRSPFPNGQFHGWGDNVKR